MPGHRDHLGTLVFTHHRAAVHPGGKQVLRNRKGLQHIPVPGAGAGIQHLAGGGNGGFAHIRPAQGVSEQIGHKQQAAGFFPGFCVLLLHRQQLEQGVDGHDLAAGGGIQGIRIHPGHRFFHHALGAAVPVVHRVAQQVSVFVQQAKVHAPGIKPDAVKRTRFFNSLMHIGHQVGKIPAEMPVPLPGAVLKAVSFFIGKVPVLVFRQNGPAAGCAEVKGQYPLHSTTPFFSRMFA